MSDIEVLGVVDLPTIGPGRTSQPNEIEWCGVRVDQMDRDMLVKFIQTLDQHVGTLSNIINAIARRSV